jgi:hypothetical protein
LILLICIGLSVELVTKVVLVFSIIFRRSTIENYIDSEED